MSQLTAGMTFQFDDRPEDDHLYVVISRVSYPEVVVVSITTKRRFTDTSCELQTGDHPFIIRDSCIAYNYAEVISTGLLSKKLQRQEICVRQKCSDDLLLRILDGAERSRFLPNRCADLLRAQSLIS